jgi:hypothetical protein
MAEKPPMVKLEAKAAPVLKREQRTFLCARNVMPSMPSRVISPVNP